MRPLRQLLEQVCCVCGASFKAWNCAKRKYCSRKCYHSTHATHGQTDTRLHRIWSGIKFRCTAKHGRMQLRYSGQGISVCQEWADSFDVFHSWAMQTGYLDGLEIDRIDSTGNYEPANCRWATRSQQLQNTRKRQATTSSAFKGVLWNKQNSKWIARIRLNGKVTHLGTFVSESQAAMSYDAAAKRLFGEFAKVNFPEPPRGEP